MMQRLTNNLKRSATLLELVKSVDTDDRPVQSWKIVRTIKYATLGITASEKYLSMQAKTDVVKRIRIRRDDSIQQKSNRIKIADVDYKITRLFVDEDNHMMELSLDYVD